MARIGRSVGYQDGQMIGKVLRGNCFLLGALETVNLSRLASALGFELIADASSARGKHTVPTPDAAEDFALDGDTTPERLALHESAGLFGVSEGDPIAQSQHAGDAVAAATALLRETRMPLQPSAGDSLPSEPAIPMQGSAL